MRKQKDRKRKGQERIRKKETNKNKRAFCIFKLRLLLSVIETYIHIHTQQSTSRRWRMPFFSLGFWSPFLLQLDLFFHRLLLQVFHLSPPRKRQWRNIPHLFVAQHHTRGGCSCSPRGSQTPSCLIQTKLLKWPYLTPDEDSWVSSHRQNAAWAVVVVVVVVAAAQLLRFQPSTSCFCALLLLASCSGKKGNYGMEWSERSGFLQRNLHSLWQTMAWYVCV